MVSYRVFRDCPGRPRKYIRRVSAHWAVWHPDVTLAQRFALWAVYFAIKEREVTP